MKVLPYFHGHFGPLIKSIISSSIGDDIVPLVAVHATCALNNHPINLTIFFTCNLRFSNNKNLSNGKFLVSLRYDDFEALTSFVLELLELFVDRLLRSVDSGLVKITVWFLVY